MVLMDKKHRRRNVGSRTGRRTYKKRRRTGLYVFVGLVVLALGMLAYLGVGNTLLGDGSETVERVETPTVEGPPEAVSDERAKAEEQARAEERAGTEERAAAEEQAARQQAAEERAAARAEAEAAAAPSDPTMYLTVPALGIANVPVVNDVSEAGLTVGAGHVPETGFPWQKGSNTYIAGHRIGYPGTASDHVFYNLPNMGAGDEIIITDSNGTTYTYAVTNIVEVSPTDTWIMAPPSSGADMVSLQTCIENFGDHWTEGPNWFGRYVVQAERVS